jgi:hypothetical protein
MSQPGCARRVPEIVSFLIVLLACACGGLTSTQGRTPPPDTGPPGGAPTAADAGPLPPPSDGAALPVAPPAPADAAPGPDAPADDAAAPAPDSADGAAPDAGPAGDAPAPLPAPDAGAPEAPSTDAAALDGPIEAVPPRESGEVIWQLDTGHTSFGLAVDRTGVIVVGGAAFQGGQGDFVLARYSQLGTMLARKQFGGLGDQAINALELAADGTIVVTGSFAGRADFGGQTRTAVGQQDLFVGSYTPEGTLKTVVTFGGPEVDEGYGLVVDPAGDWIVVGYGGPLAIGAQTVTNGFLFRVQPSGTVRWAREAGGTGVIQLSATGPVVAAGGGPDLSQLSSHARGNGAPVWMQSAGAQASVYDVGVDGRGRLLVTGGFTRSLTVAGQEVASQGSSDIFVMALAPDTGLPVWAQVIAGSQGQDNGIAVCGDRDGNVYVGGVYEGSAAITLGEPIAPPRSIIAKLDASGNRLWAKVLPSPGAGVQALACDAVGGVLVGLNGALAKLVP